jgi:hypothetical protein
MKIEHLLSRLLGPCGYEVTKKRPEIRYDQDGLSTLHNHDFMQDAAFRQAYERGVSALGGVDRYHWHWRVHVGLWVASCAAKLRGDFVECGVNYGFLSSAIMRYLDWNSLDKTFWLLDTFQGMDERYVSEEEKRAGALEASRSLVRSGHYVAKVDSVQANFAEWKNVRIIAGAIPETLERVTARELAYLHLDMNCAPPEIAAVRFFWPRLIPGAFVLLDDYGQTDFRLQKQPMDAFARENGVQILSLPTGQGLMAKPASDSSAQAR